MYNKEEKEEYNDEKLQLQKARKESKPDIYIINQTNLFLTSHNLQFVSHIHIYITIAKTLMYK